jgi:hypothetical protein
MTKEEFLKVAIKDYKEALEHIRKIKEYQRAIWYLQQRHMNWGVCLYAKTNYAYDIYDKPWVRGKNQINNWWCATPSHCADVPDVLKVLELRINLLEQELFYTQNHE